MEFISRSTTVMIIVSDTFLELSSSAQSTKELTPQYRTWVAWRGHSTKGKKNWNNLASLLYLSLVENLGTSIEAGNWSTFANSLINRPTNSILEGVGGGSEGWVTLLTSTNLCIVTIVIIIVWNLTLKKKKSISLYYR